MSVLRFRQLSTGRFYVPRNELDERRTVREGRETPTCSLELAARAGRLSGLRLVPRGREVVEPADKLLLLVGEAEHGREPARRDEVLAAFDRAFGVPERGAHPVLAGWPVVVHAGPY